MDQHGGHRSYAYIHGCTAHASCNLRSVLQHTQPDPPAPTTAKSQHPRGRASRAAWEGRVGSHSPETLEEAGPQPPDLLSGFSGVSGTERRPKAATLHTPLTLHCAGDKSPRRGHPLLGTTWSPTHTQAGGGVHTLLYLWSWNKVRLKQRVPKE